MTTDAEWWFGGASWERTSVDIVRGAHKRLLSLEVVEERPAGLDNPYPAMAPKDLVERWARAVRAGLWGSPASVTVQWVGGARSFAEVAFEGADGSAFSALGWLAHSQAYGSFRCVEKSEHGLVSARALEPLRAPDEPGFEIEVAEEGGDGGDDLAIVLALAPDASETTRVEAQEILGAWGGILGVGAFPGRDDEPLSHGYPEPIEEPYANELLLRITNAQWEPEGLSPLIDALASLHARTGALRRLDA